MSSSSPYFPYLSRKVNNFKIIINMSSRIVSIVVMLNHPDCNNSYCNLRPIWSWILPYWVNEMHCHIWHIWRTWHLSCLSVFCPSQSSLMRAEEQQKQMELPVGLWEDSGRARMVVWEEAGAMWWCAYIALWSYLLQ